MIIDLTRFEPAASMGPDGIRLWIAPEDRDAALATLASYGTLAVRPHRGGRTEVTLTFGPVGEQAIQTIRVARQEDEGVTYRTLRLVALDGFLQVTLEGVFHMGFHLPGRSRVGVAPAA